MNPLPPLPPLPPIPTPARRRWTAFCTEKLPLIVFAIGVLAVALLWNSSASAPALVAEAETISAEVRAVAPGTLASLDVVLLQSVVAGQIIARVNPADPTVLAASLAIIRAEIDLLRTNLEPVLPAQRVALDASRLQLDWMRERVSLASLRVQLRQARSEFARLGPLHDKKIITEEAFEAARLQTENLSAQLNEQSQLVDTLAPAALAFAARSAELTPRSAAETLAAAVRVHEETLRLTEAQLGPAVLTAPLSGLVSLVHRRPGEAIHPAEPIVTIVAEKPVRLIGYLRQPLMLEPKPGMPVEIRTRTPARQVAQTTITEVGRVMEPVSLTVLALLNRSATPELGLRVHIAVPPTLALRPGEQVDVMIRN